MNTNGGKHRRSSAPLAIVAVVLLAVIPAATAAPLAGIVDASSIEFTTSERLQGSAFLLGIPSAGESSQFSSWSFTASAATIEMHGRKWNEFAGSANDGNIEPVNYGPYQYGSAAGESLRVGSLFSLSATPPDTGAGVFQVFVDGQQALFRPAETATFPPEGEVLAKERARSLDRGGARLDPSGAQGPITVEGDVVLDVFDNDFAVRGDQSDPEMYETGIFRRNKVGGEIYEPGVKADYEERFARISLTGAVLTLVPAQQAYQLHFRDAELLLDGKARLAGAHGTLEAGGKTWSLKDEALEVDADAATFQITSDGNALHSRLDGDAEVLWIDGSRQTLLPADAQVDAAPWGSWPIWAGGLALAAVGGGVFFVLRRRGAKMDPDFLCYQAEEELVRGNYERAIAQTRRALANDPTHLNATVTQAIALLKVGRPGDAVEFLRKQVARVHNDEGILRLLESLGLFEIGKEEEGVKELEIALQGNPALGEKLATTDLWDRVKHHPRLLQLMPTEDPGASYV